MEGTHVKASTRGATRRPRRLAAIAIATAASVSAALLTPATAGLAAPSAGAVGFPLAPVHAYDSWQGDTWGGTSGTAMADVAKVIGATSTAAAGLDGTGVGVALIDTGVVAVPGLPGSRIVNGPDLSFESQASTLRYQDTFGHGTHMAGIIAGYDASVGFKGIAPKVKLTSIKVGGAGGVVDVSQIIAAVDWVVQHRNDDPSNPIRVLNISYGTTGNQGSTVDPLAFAVENAWRKGIVVVVAAGNSGARSNLTNPAYDPYVLSVGSASTNGTVAQSDDGISSFTTTAASRDVDLLAPGESIISLRDPGSYVDVNYPSARVGTALFRGTGSSQATAVVSGAAALLLQKRPTMTPDQVKALLKSTATGVSAGVGEINLTTALATSTPSATQTWTRSTGIGSIEFVRGGVHVMHDSAALEGEFDVFGPFAVGEWSVASAAGTAWKGGSWMSRRMAGDGWTGSSWASKTWAGATWSGGPWGAASWIDPTWSGHYWSGHYWSSTSWNGHYWSSDNWSTSTWG